MTEDGELRQVLLKAAWHYKEHHSWVVRMSSGGRFKWNHQKLTYCDDGNGLPKDLIAYEVSTCPYAI